ncbi:MAG TPA: helicase HerA-like domain-containing protein [Actinomycetota bacterium]|nr:helicase HerA-like domain-containing protein [Actinomycetota bacterium]
MDEAFAAEMAAGYATEEPSVVLGSPMLDGEVLSEVRVGLPLSSANRHGLIAGATGTGKTKTLQVLAGQLSAAGVPVFVADVKGDLTGLAAPGDPIDAKVRERVASLAWPLTPAAHPVELLSLTGALGAPVRATISSFGPLLLGKVMDLNETQTSVLSMVFAYCDDNDLALLDIEDLRTTLQFLTSDEGKPALESYGGMSRSTVGVLLRALVTMEQEGIGGFFGEPAFEVEDLLRTTPEGAGVISVLELSDVMAKPRLFSTFLLWMLAQLYGALPEVGDLPKPKLAFFFDEAHLLFDDASDALMEQIELTARLIRSKGVGVYFVTQAPTDVPSSVLSQLGNRIQHALRAFTPQDADDLRKTARTFPSTEHYDVEEAITSLGIGEALVTVLSPTGVPSPLAATRLIPPDSRMSPADPAMLERLANGSPLRVKYLEAPDRESAHEILSARIAAARSAASETSPGVSVEGPRGQKRRRSTTPKGPTTRTTEKSTTQRAIEAGLKTVSSAEGQRTIRVLFGTLFGKR